MAEFNDYCIEGNKASTHLMVFSYSNVLHCGSLIRALCIDE